MISQYNQDKAKKLICKILTQENGEVTNENTIKCWSQPIMNISDVMYGIRYVKSIGENRIIYTNKVPHKERLSKENNLIILDVDNLSDLALKYKEYSLYDMLSK